MGGYNVQKDIFEAYKWLKKAAVRGHEDSIAMLDFPEFVGLDVPSSYDEDENANENLNKDTLDDDLDYLEQEYDFQRNRVQQLLNAKYITMQQAAEYRKKLDETFNLTRGLWANKKFHNPVLPQIENLDYFADIVDFTDTTTYCEKLRASLSVDVEELQHDGYGFEITRPIRLSTEYHLWRSLFDVGGKYHTHRHSYGMQRYYFDSIIPSENSDTWQLKKFFEVDLEKGAENAHPFAEMRTRCIGLFEQYESGKIKVADLYFDSLGFDVAGAVFPSDDWFKGKSLPNGFCINKK